MISGMVFSSMRSQSVGGLVHFSLLLLVSFLMGFHLGSLSLQLLGRMMWEGMIQIINDC